MSRSARFIEAGILTEAEDTTNIRADEAGGFPPSLFLIVICFCRPWQHHPPGADYSFDLMRG